MSKARLVAGASGRHAEPVLCSACGQEYGAHFAPDGGGCPGYRINAVFYDNCPRCGSAELHSAEVNGISATECLDCGGVWPNNFPDPNPITRLVQNFLNASVAFAKAHVECDRLDALDNGDEEAVTEDEFKAASADYRKTKAEMVAAFHAMKEGKA